MSTQPYSIGVVILDYMRSSTWNLVTWEANIKTCYLWLPPY